MESYLIKRRVLGAAAAAVLVLGLAVWAQQLSLIRGGFSSAGGVASSGDVTVTGSLGSWYDTSTLQDQDGLILQPGRPQTPAPAGKVGDLDGDADVDFTDFLFFGETFNTQTGDPAFNPDADFDSNGIIDFGDFLVFSAAFEG